MAEDVTLVSTVIWHVREMTTEEARVQDLYNALRELLGTERADTLMTHLLDATNDLATKDDIGRLETRFDGLERRFDVLEMRFDGLERRFGALETRFDGLETQGDRRDEKLDNGIASVNQRIDRLFLTQSAGWIAVVGTLIAALLL